MGKALIIEGFRLCNLICEHCQGTKRALTGNYLLTPPVSLPAEITLEELKEVVTNFKDRGLFGADRITAIRFGGEWSEPTLDSRLSEKIQYLLNEVPGLQTITVFTNGVTLSHADYSNESMRKWFLDRFGFDQPPGKFILTLSVDDYHLASYQSRRKREKNVQSQDSEREYKEKIINLIHYFQEMDCNVHLIINFVKSALDDDDFEQIQRRKFNIPQDLYCHCLRKAIYSPFQSQIMGAIDLVPTAESPSKGEVNVYMRKSLKHKGKILLYPSIADFGYDKNGLPFNEFRLN